MSSLSEHLETDNMKQSSLWWLKSTAKTVPNPQININDKILTLPSKLDLDISTSLDEFLDKENEFKVNDDASDADIGSIIEEINKLASQSPIGTYENVTTDKSVDEILQEAEKLYLESSKSFEQLSSRNSDYSLSKSSSISFKSKKSTPSPKAAYFKLAQDLDKLSVISDEKLSPEDEEYSEDFSKISGSKISSVKSNKSNGESIKYSNDFSHSKHSSTKSKSLHKSNEYMDDFSNSKFSNSKSIVKPNEYNNDIADVNNKSEKTNKFVVAPNSNRNSENSLNNGVLLKDYNINNETEVFEEHFHVEQDDEKDELQERTLEPEVDEEQEEPDNDIEELHQEIENLKIQLKETKNILEENESSLNKQSFSIQQELDATIEELKDTKEQNTVLQVQLANLTKTHQNLRVNYEELLSSKKNLELRIAEIDANFLRCKTDLVCVKDNNEKLSESETNFKKQLEIEKLQSKTSRLQNEKDAKCILDLNRQVKEMERIIQRKHPDSVSALIVASKNELDSPTCRNLLESRIKQLENEASLREIQSNNVFSEIQDKFNQMKSKYESHIEDLETHVNDLKHQLRTRVDTYDIYTQTYTEEPKLTDNHVKEIYNIGTQTEYTKSPRNVPKKDKLDPREDAHLLATIRGLQFDLTAKEKLINKMQKEIEEMRKTNRKLHRDPDRNFRLDKKDNNKNDKNNKTPDTPDSIDKEIKAVKEERDKIKAHLCRLEDDYQTLKTKRLQDLNTLQEAHEREITTYMSNTGPMREQLDVQQISISTLQSQLANAKEELAIITVERDHLDARLKNLTLMEADRTPEDCTTQLSLQRKIAYLERRYEEREHRLRAIVHGLAQKQVTSSRDCAQCAARQQQLISYKAELDQLLATLRYLQ